LIAIKLILVFLFYKALLTIDRFKETLINSSARRPKALAVIIHTVIFYHINTKAQTADLQNNFEKEFCPLRKTYHIIGLRFLCFSQIYAHYAQSYPQKTGVFPLKNVKNSNSFR
jgi:hypothetical protein